MPPKRRTKSNKKSRIHNKSKRVVHQIFFNIGKGELR